MKSKDWLPALLLVASPLAALAQRADGVYQIKCMVQMNDAGDGKKTAECTNHFRQDGEIGIGGKVAFDVTTTEELMDEEGAPEVTDLIFFVDGQPLPGTHPVVEDQSDRQLPSGAADPEEKNQSKDAVVTFRLTFPITRDLSSDKGKESWKTLLGGLGKNRKEVPVSIGLINGPPLPSSYKVEFVRIGGKGLATFLLVTVVLGIGFLGGRENRGAARQGASADKRGRPAGEPSAYKSGLQPFANANRRVDAARCVCLLVRLDNHG